MAIELELQNRSSQALGGTWSLLLTHHSCSRTGGGTCSSSGSAAGAVAMAVPLGSLPAGAAWRRECQVLLPAAASSAGMPPIQLRVLLCRHGSGSEQGSQGTCVLLLHRMQLDELHLLQLGGGGGGGGSKRQQAGATGPAPAEAQVRLALQLPSSAAGLQHGAHASLLQHLLGQGLTSQVQPVQATAPLPPGGAPAAALALLQPHAQGGSTGSGTIDTSSGGSGISLAAQLQPANRPAARAQVLQVAAAAPDAAIALACGQGLCRRVLIAHAATGSQPPQRQREMPWPQLPGVGVLLPPAAAPPSAALDAAALEQTLLQLRQLQAAAMRVRDSSAADADAVGEAAGMAQRRREQQQAELARLALACPPVPVALCD